MKRILSFLIILSLTLCIIAVSYSSAGAVSANGQRLITVSDEPVYAVPSDDELISVIVFGKIDNSYTNTTLTSLTKSTLVNIDRYRFMFADIAGASKPALEEFASDYSPRITFCRGNYNSMMWTMIDDWMPGGVILPAIVFIDRSGEVCGVMEGFQSADNIAEKIKSILKDDYIEPARNPDYPVVEVRGFYYTNIQAAIDRVNEIRYEACREGIENPEKPSTPLTLADYHPVVWSAELESITRLRAAEAAIRIGHTRPNGERCFTANTFQAATSVAENLAWNHSTDMLTGIEQFYDEKKDWIDHTGNQTGHYTNMISPRYRSMGIGCFNSSCGYFSTSLCMWLSNVGAGVDQTFGTPSGYVSVPFVIHSGFLSNPSLIVGKSMQAGKSTVADFMADTNIEGFKGYVYLCEDVTWKSSDDSVLTVADGRITGVGAGVAAVTASLECGLQAGINITINAAPTEPSTQPPTVPPTVPPTDPPTDPPTELPTPPSIIPPGDLLRGDSDCDGEITILDATAIQRSLANLPTTINKTAADADADGEITILDATAIQRKIAGLPAFEGIGKPILT